MSENVFDLFDDFAVRQARGENPDPVEYLDRAGDAEAELSELLELFLEWAPARDPDPEAVLMMNAWLAGEAPLVVLRVDRRLRVDDVVDSLTGELDLNPAKRSKVRRYVQRFEQGFLDPSNVDQRVLGLVSSRLGTSLDTLLAWASAPIPAAGRPATLYRAQTTPTEPSPSATVEQEEWDEIDELFLGARGA